MPSLPHPVSKDFSLHAFVVATTITGVAVSIRAALDPALPGLPPFITLFPALALTALLCGPISGAITGLLGLVAAIYLWIPPKFSFGLPNLTDGISVGMFVLASLIMLWAGAILRAQLNAATIAKQALDLGLAAGGVGTWEINLRTRRISASPTAHALHGLHEGSERTVAEDWLRGVHPDDEAAARTALQAAVAAGTVASYTYRVFDPNQGPRLGPRWVAARGRVVTAGGERRLLCALVDITEQVRAQDELKRERERLRLALAAGSLAVWDFDVRTGEANIDPRYAATMGFDPSIQSLTQAEIGERIHPEDLPRVAAEHDAFVAAGGNDERTNYHIEFRIITPAGEVRWLQSQGILIRDRPDDRGRMVGIIQDITDRRRREDDLRDLAATRELLVREADHRIKNSLQLVISLLTVQLRGIEDQAAADALRGAIARVGAIAASHLALQGSADLMTIDLAVTLRELCAHFAELHPAIRILCSPGESLMLDADRAIPLGLAVSEVLTNALRHGFPDRTFGTVIVEATAERSELLVRISDDGVGMAAQASGTGLGSRIIRSLAARLAATVDIDSTPDAGTVVTLRLPLIEENTPQPAMA